jgi:RNA polymerase sigma factor (sigma-70 family)
MTMNDATLDQIVEQAYAAHHDPLQRRLTAVTRDPAAAEDLAQEAFLRLVVEVRAGRVPDQPGAWLYRVAHNLAMSRGRRLSVAARNGTRLADAERAPSPEAMAIEAEDSRLLNRALDGLAAADRQALVLAAHGYRGQEIARTLGRSDGATRTLLCRARTKVRERMVGAGSI